MYSDPLAFFITWTCYGTWLPGDDRRWTKYEKGMRLPQPRLEDWCAKRLKDKPIYLSQQHRNIVESTISEHCRIRSWIMHAVNCRTNHCHCVITALDYDGESVRDQLKAWCSRKLNENTVTGHCEKDRRPNKWWTRKGSVRYIFDDLSLEAAIIYTIEAQEFGGSGIWLS